MSDLLISRNFYHHHPSLVPSVTHSPASDPFQHPYADTSLGHTAAHAHISIEGHCLQLMLWLLCCITHCPAKWQCWLICGRRLNWDNWSRSCLCPGDRHKDTWMGCSAAPQWLQLTARWISPTPTSVYFCVPCWPCCGTQEGSGGRKHSHLPCLICSHV